MKNLKQLNEYVLADLTSPEPIRKDYRYEVRERTWKKLAKEKHWHWLD